MTAPRLATLPSKPATAVKAVPRLDMSGPRRNGLLAAAALLGLVGIGAALPVPVTVMASTTGRTHSDPIVVRHPEGGVIAAMHVREGDDVTAGQKLASFDTRLLDNQIAGLRRQIDGIRISIGGLKQEAEGLAGIDRASPLRQRLVGLEAQTAASEQEVLGLEVRLAMAEQERTRTDVVATLAGRVTKILAGEGSHVHAGGGIVAVQPQAVRLTLDATWAVPRSVAITAGQPVSIRPADASLFTPAMTGKIEQILFDDARGLRLRVSADLPTDTVATPDARERRFTLHLITGARTMFERALSPLSPRPQADTSTRMNKASL